MKVFSFLMPMFFLILMKVPIKKPPLDLKGAKVFSSNQFKWASGYSLVPHSGQKLFVLMFLAPQPLQ